MILTLMLTGCVPVTASPTIAVPVPPSPSATLAPSLTLTHTATFTSTFTHTPQLSPTHTSTPSPTPGPDLSFLYLADGSIQKYNLQTWSSQELPVQSEGAIIEAVLSPDQKWLAVKDTAGIKVFEYPYSSPPIGVFPLIAIPSIDPGNTPLLFSSNSRLLAYYDQEGLKIYNLDDQTVFTLFTHSPYEGDVYNVSYYIPLQWSPDSQWLWIYVMGWEGSYNILAHIPPQSFLEFNSCYREIAWLPTSQAFVAAVTYSGRAACGEDDGIVLVEYSTINTSEERIYHVDSSDEPWTRFWQDLKLSPDGENLSFTLRPFSESDLPDTRPTRIFIMDLSTKESMEIDSNLDWIGSSVWSADSSRLFYFLPDEKKIQLVSHNIDSGETIKQCSLSIDLTLVANIGNGDWLVAGITKNKGADWNSLYLLNVNSCDVKRIANLDYESHIMPFLGVVPAR
jgi:hypothetical protein